ncbi:MAG: hypothetical protein AAF039_13520 [Bacteroidota bacterium]
MKLVICHFLMLCIVFLNFSCGQGKKDNIKTTTQMEQVMAIHDEVMPKMGTLAKYTAELKAKVDTTEMGQQYEAAMKDLQNANSSMMDWMMGFGDRFDSDEILNGKKLTPQKLEWLNEEEAKVKAVKEQIHSSIENAERLLGKNQ